MKTTDNNFNQTETIAETSSIIGSSCSVSAETLLKAGEYMGLLGKAVGPYSKEELSLRKKSALRKWLVGAVYAIFVCGIISIIMLWIR